MGYTSEITCDGRSTLIAKTVEDNHAHLHFTTALGTWFGSARLELLLIACTFEPPAWTTPAGPWNGSARLELLRTSFTCWSPARTGEVSANFTTEEWRTFYICFWSALDGTVVNTPSQEHKHAIKYTYGIPAG